MRLAPLALAGLLALVPGALAQTVNGTNARYVEYGQADGLSFGRMIQTGPEAWTEHVDGAVTATYDETGRDEWSVYLRRIDGRVHLQLDLHRREVLSELASDPGMTKLYDVLDVASFEAYEPAPGFAYRLESLVGGGGSLDTYSGDENTPFLGETGNYSGQIWTFTPLGDGAHRLTNSFLGPGRSLDTYSDGSNAPFMAQTGNYSGQIWTLVPLDGSLGDAGVVRLTNQFLGPRRALAAGDDRSIVMSPWARSADQHWSLTRLGRR